MMKQIIRDVLDDMKYDQINMGSEAAREAIASLVTAALKAKGRYSTYSEYELDEQEAIKAWVCEICGKNTFGVEDDYIGSGYNHLGCELEVEK